MDQTGLQDVGDRPRLRVVRSVVAGTVPVIAEYEFLVVVVFWPSHRIDGNRIPFGLLSG